MARKLGGIHPKAAANALRRGAPRQTGCSRLQRIRKRWSIGSSNKKLGLCKICDSSRAGGAAQWQGKGMERAGARMQGRCVRRTLRQQQLELAAAPSASETELAHNKVGVVERCVAHGTGWLRRKPNFNLRDHVRVRCGRSAQWAALAPLALACVRLSLGAHRVCTSGCKNRIVHCTILLYSLHQLLDTAIVGGNARRESGTLDL